MKMYSIPMAVLTTMPAAVSHAAQHLAEVSAHYPATVETDFLLQLPVWRPGRYQLFPLANGICQMVATGKDGRPLAARKIDKASWRIEKAPGEPVSVRYELFANLLSLRAGVQTRDEYLDEVASTVDDYLHQQALFRRDQMQTLTVTPTPRDKGTRKLKAVDEISREQKLLNARWLGIAWPEESNGLPTQNDVK